MAKNQTYRSFIARPSHVLDLNGELLDSAPVSTSLASEIRDISAYATFVVRNDVELGDELARVTATAPAESACRRACARLAQSVPTMTLSPNGWYASLVSWIAAWCNLVAWM